MSAIAPRAVIGATRGGARVVGAQELRDLWLAGRGPLLLLAYSVLVSVVTYLTATTQSLNFLEQREAVSLVTQVAIGVGALLALLAAADAVSGERERGTLESMLLTPVSRPALAGGKLAAALSLWLATLVVAVPYLVFVARGVGIVGEALAAALLVGFLLAAFVAGLGLSVSIVSATNRTSLSVSLFVLLALLAPTQLPTSFRQGWAGELFIRLNPFNAGFRFVGKVIIDGRPWSGEISWLLAPVVGAALATGIAFALAARRLRLLEGSAR